MAKSNKTRFSYVLYSDKTWVFDQSERAQGLIYITARIKTHVHNHCPVHITPEEFENGGFTLKTHQMLLVFTTPEKFENATITG